MALNFFLYDSLKNAVCNDPTQPSSWEKFGCGSTAGGLAGLVSQPMNTCGARLAVAPAGTYSGVADCVKKTFMEGGIKSLYKGFSVNLPRIVLSRGGEMTIFNSLAETFVPEGEHISPMQGLAFGGSASAVVSTCTYPLLLARTKLQTQGTAGIPILYSSWVDCLKTTYNGNPKLGIPRGAGMLNTGVRE